MSTILRKNGATYLTYPSAFAYSTGLAHWESLLRARAIENQCYVIAPAQVGFHNEKRQSYGHAMVRNAFSRYLATTQSWRGAHQLPCEFTYCNFPILGGRSMGKSAG